MITETTMKISTKTLRRNFLKYSCSGALLFAFDREFENSKLCEEQAAGTLGGGMMQTGHQCGMLWGASLGSGAEAYRRYGNNSTAFAVSTEATTRLVDSYKARSKTTNCREVTGCNPSTPLGLFRYLILGKTVSCMNLGVKWAPEALEAVKPVLDSRPESGECRSCASEAARRMGATDEEVVMVSGFAGGLGLSGNLCGALAAVVWMKSLQRIREGKSIVSVPEAKSTLKRFRQHTGGELRCRLICGRSFASLKEHSDFLADGGCSDILNLLIQA